MKFSCLVLVALVAYASAASSHSYDDHYLNGTSYKERQLCVLKLLNGYMNSKTYKEIEEIAMSYKFEDNIDKYEKPEVVKRFYNRIKYGHLPRGEIFCMYCEKQMEEVIDMFHVLYYAKDFATFYKSACYMRYYMNEGMFTYAFTVACRHREDCSKFYLPAPYEIYPYFFVRSDVIQRAYLLKLNKGLITDTKLCEYYGIRKIDDGSYVLDEHLYDGRTDLSHEDKLRYFTEDIDLNSYYYYFHVDFPYWMGDQYCESCKHRRSEISLYYYQQILARYYLERLSHGMCDVHDIDYYQPIKTGYWPFLRYHNGVEVPMRHNYYNIEHKGILRKVEDYERLIRDAIYKGYYIGHDGVKYALKTYEDIENLGKLCHGNCKGDEYYCNYYKYLFVLMKTMIGLTEDYRRHDMIPTALDNYQTALRDPVFYQLLKRFLRNYIYYKRNLPAYTRDEYHFPGIKVNNVQVDKLVTYFSDYTMDMSNALVMSQEELAKSKYDYRYYVKKQRLNHLPFNIEIDVSSDKAVDSVVRIFLGPKMDCMDRYYYDINENRYNFVELDSFIYKLNVGKNAIHRRSSEIHNTVKDRIMTKDFIEKCEGSGDCHELYKDYENIYSGYPQRLILPIGRKSGMDLLLYVIVTPYRPVELSNELKEKTSSYMYSCRYGACLDKMPLGFPFDREINIKDFNTPNMKFVDVKIFHKDINDYRHGDDVCFYEKYHMNPYNDAYKRTYEHEQDKY